MDIFLIEKKDADNVQEDLLLSFRKKSFSDLEKQKEHCFSYLMTDRILKEVYKIDNREIEFINKKPFLKSKDKFFSISHSKDYIALAFSDSNCAIDIEIMKERDFSAISKRMNIGGSSKENFYKEWTKYEAQYKLGETPQSSNHFIFKEYAITALSTNINETFEIYIQNGEYFPKLKT